LFNKIRHIILAIIDFCHIPFARVIPTQTFRYLACGGSNTVLNIFIEWFSINYLLHHEPTHLFGNVVIAPEVAAWMIAFVISFPAGFILSRHIVFPESNLHGHIQLFRYALVTISFILLSYLLVKFFATYVPGLNATVAYTFICIITAILSYISQRKFTFKISPADAVGVGEEVVPD